MAKKGSQFTTYHPDFKLQVVEDYLSGKSGGLTLIARKYGLKSKSQVENWVKKYRKNPDLLKQDLRGKSSTSRPKSIKLEDMTLEEQNIYLRMENDILKTLRALLKK